jgi:hypothetical protein
MKAFYCSAMNAIQHGCRVLCNSFVHEWNFVFQILSFETKIFFVVKKNNPVNVKKK